MLFIKDDKNDHYADMDAVVSISYTDDLLTLKMYGNSSIGTINYSLKDNPKAEEVKEHIKALYATGAYLDVSDAFGTTYILKAAINYAQFNVEYPSIFYMYFTTGGKVERRDFTDEAFAKLETYLKNISKKEGFLNSIDNTFGDIYVNTRNVMVISFRKTALNLAEFTFKNLGFVTGVENEEILKYVKDHSL